MITIQNIEALDRLQARFAKIAHPDARGLMKTWMGIIERDNRRGVMAGLDKDGNPLVPVTYRPIGAPVKTTKSQRLGRKGSERGVFGGHGPQASGLHNNLTSAEYRRLGGPPLAPRGVFSRVITNLRTEWDHPSETTWTADGVWREVVSTKGDKFLRYHFHGIGGTIRRDLTGVRPEGIKEAKAAARNWMIDIVRSGV